MEYYTYPPGKQGQKHSDKKVQSENVNYVSSF